MPSRSKSKGNKFENDIVKAFNELHETEEFRRTPNSGAMMGLTNAAKFAGLSESVKRTLSSDIICPDWYRFAIECKHYGDQPNYSTIIKGNDAKLDHWLGEAIFDAYNLNLHPMLCFKTDRKGAHVAIPSYWCHHFGLFPAFHLVYDSVFTIMGLEQWLVIGPTFVNKYSAQESDAMKTLREAFIKEPEVKKFLKLLEK